MRPDERVLGVAMLKAHGPLRLPAWWKGPTMRKPRKKPELRARPGRRRAESRKQRVKERGCRRA